MIALRSVQAAWTQPASLAQRRGFNLLVLAITAALLAWHSRTTLPYALPIDDAYITLHNARVLAGEPEVNYVGVPAMIGATSAVHVAFAALLMRFFSPVGAMYAAAWCAVFAYALGLARLAFVHRGSLVHALLLVTAGLFVAQMPHQLLNGLETGLALAALTWTLALASDDLSKGRVVAMLSGILPFCRPELLAASLLVLGYQATRRWQAKTSALQVARSIGMDVALAALGASPWLLLHAVSTGVPYPLTVSSKRMFFAEGCLPAATKRAWIATGVRGFFDEIGYFSRVLVLLLATRLGWAGIVFAVTLIAVYYREFPGAFGHYEHRYLYVLVPFMLYAAASGFAHRARVVRFASVAFLLVAIEQSAWSVRDYWNMQLGFCRFTAVQLGGVAEWANANLPKDTKLLVHDAGYISYATQFRMVDLVGLKTPPSAAVHRSVTWPSCGARRGDAIAEIARTQKPDYLVVVEVWNKLFGISRALAVHGWSVERVRPGDGGYEVYKLTPP